MPSALNPNAGMSEQEQQMVKAVCDPYTFPTNFRWRAAQHSISRDRRKEGTW
jgi:hypothetical protein